MPTEIAKRETYDPWTEMDRAFDEIRSRIFGMAPFWGLGDGSPASNPLRSARTDVADTGSAYRIVAEVPGIPKDHLDIRVKGTSVEIRGEAETSASSPEAEYVHRERAYSGFYRHLELPEPVIPAQAKAKVENGVLELELPKQNPTPDPSEVKIRVE